MRKSGFFAGLILLVTFSCNLEKDRYKETRDRDLTLQVFRLKTDSTGNGEVNYKVRIVPAGSFGNSLGKEARNALLYRMDSCFYLKAGYVKINPAMVQPVANGVRNSYEYLVTFDKAGEGNDKCEFIYWAKSLNNKKYTIKLTN